MLSEAGSRRITAGAGSGRAPTGSSAPEEVRAVFVGDSYTVGLGGDGTSYVEPTAAAMRWTAVNLGASGTGYLSAATAGPYRERLDGVLAADPDVVVVQGSTNDLSRPPAEVGAAAAQLYAELTAIVPADREYGYRNKLEYSFAPGEDGLVLGFHRAGRWDEVIDVEECLLTTDVGNAIRETVKRWAREEQLEPYDQETATGYLRHLVVREGRNTGQVLVLLVTAPGERFDADYLVETLTAFPQVRSIHWAVNDRPAELTNLATRLLWGEAWIEEQLCGLRFRIRPNAFLQTNTSMAERLYGLAREAAQLRGDETVYDLYCGTGTIGLSFAADAASVWGVEISEESVACAIENAAANGIENARFFAGNVGQSLQELRETAGPPDVVVVDPPRAGLAGKALRRTGALGAPRLVYVSCNPTTLASDLAVLRDDYGYTLEGCTPVDMFPHTPHIESVSSLLLPIDRRGEQNQGAARQ